MRYICNSLVRRARSAHNAHKFVSMFSFIFKALRPFEKRRRRRIRKDENKELIFHQFWLSIVVSVLLKIAKFSFQEQDLQLKPKMDSTLENLHSFCCVKWLQKFHQIYTPELFSQIIKQMQQLWNIFCCTENLSFLITLFT